MGFPAPTGELTAGKEKKVGVSAVDTRLVFDAILGAPETAFP